MNDWSWLMLHNFLNPIKQTFGLSEPSSPYLLISGPTSSNSSSQPRFTAWLPLGTCKPRTSSSHLILLYSSGRVALGRTEEGADLGLHHPGNSRACTLSGRLQTTLEHNHPGPAQLILHRERRLGVSSHSQSLQLNWPG